MTVLQAAESLGLQILATGDLGANITGCTVCDLLSLVMAGGVRGGAWITVQTHVNVVAVSTLLDLACIIVPDGINIEEQTLNKAAEEGITMLSSKESAFTLAGRLYELGVR
jgi:hypothetical protein